MSSRLSRLQLGFDQSTNMVRRGSPLQQGFYREAGLDGPDLDAAKALAAGQADFGVCTSSILLHPGPTTGTSILLVPRRADNQNVAYWHNCDIAPCRPQFRLRRLSGRGAETPEGPGLTRSGPRHALRTIGSLIGAGRQMRRAIGQAERLLHLEVDRHR